MIRAVEEDHYTSQNSSNSTKHETTSSNLKWHPMLPNEENQDPWMMKAAMTDPYTPKTSPNLEKKT